MDIEKINFNGKVIPISELNISHSNRSFKYGDGLFESIKMVSKNMPLLPFHIERLLAGMKALKIDIPSYFNLVFFKNEIAKLANNQPDSRIRIQIYRADGGHYSPLSNAPIFLIEAISSPDSLSKITSKGLTVGWFDQTPIFSKSSTSNFKTNNSIPYILAAIHAKTYTLDDCLLFNEKSHIVEGISSNIFLVKNNKVITPALSSGCVAGIMRRKVIDLAMEENIKIREQKVVKAKHIFEADHLFLTNAVQGIRWIEKVDYTNFLRGEITERLHKRVAELFS